MYFDLWMATFFGAVLVRSFADLGEASDMYLELKESGETPWVMVRNDNGSLATVMKG